MGASGTGKSASLRNFRPDEIGVINVAGKPLPFRSEIKSFKSDRYEEIEVILKKAKVKSLVIDDSQYLMANEFMRRASENGFQKFTDIGRNFWALVDMINHDLPEDVIVYFMQHTELDANGNEKAKTIGKLLDEKITLEGLFSIVLKTAVVDGSYMFTTKNNGADTVKTPMGMFEQDLIENDLKAVDDAIREYYGLKEEK
jgi:hypothetical protein